MQKTLLKIIIKMKYKLIYLLGQEVKTHEFEAEDLKEADKVAQNVIKDMCKVIELRQLSESKQLPTVKEENLGWFVEATEAGLQLIVKLVSREPIEQKLRRNLLALDDSAKIEEMMMDKSKCEMLSITKKLPFAIRIEHLENMMNAVRNIITAVRGYESLDIVDKEERERRINEATSIFENNGYHE